MNSTYAPSQEMISEMIEQFKHGHASIKYLSNSRVLKLLAQSNETPSPPPGSPMGSPLVNIVSNLSDRTNTTINTSASVELASFEVVKGFCLSYCLPFQRLWFILTSYICCMIVVSAVVPILLGVCIPGACISSTVNIITIGLSICLVFVYFQFFSSGFRSTISSNFEHGPPPIHKYLLSSIALGITVIAWIATVIAIDTAQESGSSSISFDLIFAIAMTCIIPLCCFILLSFACLTPFKADANNFHKQTILAQNEAFDRSLQINLSAAVRTPSVFEQTTCTTTDINLLT